MTIRFSAPSKTFLSGEYAVLCGGPALVLATSPRFSLQATRGEETRVHGIPSGSPAARWIEARAPLLADWKIEFEDPHGGQGGFGASSAQFLFAHALTTLLQVSVSRAVAGLDLEALLSDYKVMASGQPSGVDLLAQVMGRVARVEGPQVSSGLWPFADLEFAIVRTAVKLSTHCHLSAVDRKPLAALVEPARACLKAFQGTSAEVFLACLKVFAHELRTLGLQSDNTRELIQFFEAKAWCKLAKGCGALGADTLLLFYARADRAAALENIAASGLKHLGGVDDLSDGLHMDWSWS